MAHAAPPTQYKCFIAFSMNWLYAIYPCKEQHILRPGSLPSDRQHGRSCGTEIDKNGTFLWFVHHHHNNNILSSTAFISTGSMKKIYVVNLYPKNGTIAWLCALAIVLTKRWSHCVENSRT